MSDHTGPSQRNMPAAHAAPAGRALTPFQRFICVPLGFLWLVFLGLLAVPVMIYMTLLYHATQAARVLVRGRRGAARGESGEAEERVA